MVAGGGALRTRTRAEAMFRGVLDVVVLQTALLRQWVVVPYVVTWIVAPGPIAEGFGGHLPPLGQEEVMWALMALLALAVPWQVLRRFSPGARLDLPRALLVSCSFAVVWPASTILDVFTMGWPFMIIVGFLVPPAVLILGLVSLVTSRRDESIPGSGADRIWRIASVCALAVPVIEAAAYVGPRATGAGEAVMAIAGWGRMSLACTVVATAWLWRLTRHLSRRSQAVESGVDTDGLQPG